MNDRRHGTKIGPRALRNALSCFTHSQPGAERLTKVRAELMNTGVGRQFQLWFRTLRALVI
jgi:hypothetical protein